MFKQNFDPKYIHKLFPTNMTEFDTDSSQVPNNQSNVFIPNLDLSAKPIYFIIYNRPIAEKPLSFTNHVTNYSPLGDNKSMNSDIVFNAFELIRKM